jgi:hypothetical protein
MKTDIHFWSYLAEFFTEWEKVQTKDVEKIKTRILVLATYFRKSCSLWDNVEKYGKCRRGHRWQYGAWGLHAGYLRLQTHNQNM